MFAQEDDQMNSIKMLENTPFFRQNTFEKKVFKFDETDLKRAQNNNE